ncbi:MAG: hypothetical protein IPG74_18800 [Flavobacteriales bacterium]|nr:hypothetical protein [Flavobacteriales bacterium]MBK7553376.1 hypothetical protein [Flavobacteriales bacterium]
MNLARRIRLFIIGLLIGGVAAWFFFGERITSGAWMPEARIKLRLKETLVKSTPEASSSIASWPTTIDNVRASVANGEVILKETRRHGDSLTYTVDVSLAGKPARLKVLVLEDFRIDSMATLVGIAQR